MLITNNLFYICYTYRYHGHTIGLLHKYITAHNCGSSDSDSVMRRLKFQRQMGLEMGQGKEGEYALKTNCK